MTPAQAAARHATLRWLGVPLLLSGLVLLAGGIVSLVGGGGWLGLGLGMFSTGLGLGAFGANNDAALALALTARQDGADPLPEPLSRELDQELEQDRSATLALRASPRVALAMPVVALLVQGLATWRLLG